MPDFGYDEEDLQCIDSGPYGQASYSDDSQTSAQEPYASSAFEDADATALSSGWDTGGFCAAPADGPGFEQGSIAEWGSTPDEGPGETGHKSSGKEDPWSGGGLNWGLTGDVADVALSKPALGHVISHGAEEVGGAEASGALGIVTGPLGLGLGYLEFNEGMESGNLNQTIQGGLSMGAGSLSTVEGLSTIAAYGAGDSAAAGTFGAVAADMGAAAPVVAAGAAGFAFGTDMAHVADSEATKTGLWGTGADGKNQSAMDWGASWGTDYDKTYGDGQPSIIGGSLAAVGGILGGVAGCEQVVGDGIADGVGSAWDWLTDE